MGGAVDPAAVAAAAGSLGSSLNIENIVGGAGGGAILTAIVAALVDYFGGTGGLATTGALGVMAGAAWRRGSVLHAIESSLADGSLAVIQDVADPVIEYRATGRPDKPYKAVGIHLQGEWHSLADLDLHSSNIDQPAWRETDPVPPPPPSIDHAYTD